MESPIPVSSIELDNVYRVMDKRKSLGYSARDLSFMLGYRALYVRDVENPKHTLRYTPKDNNYLQLIFECPLSDILAGKIPEVNYLITIETHSYGTVSTNTIHRLNLPQAPIRLKEFKDEDDTSVEIGTSEKIEIEKVINNLFNSVYFDQPKTALEILQSFKEIYRKTTPVHNVIAAIKKYTARRKAPRLIENKNESGRTTFLKEPEIPQE